MNNEIIIAKNKLVHDRIQHAAREYQQPEKEVVLQIVCTEDCRLYGGAVQMGFAEVVSKINANRGKVLVEAFYERLPVSDDTNPWGHLGAFKLVFAES